MSLLDENSNNYVLIMCNANCTSMGKINKNTCGKIVLCDFIFVKSNNHDNILNIKKWNYGKLILLINKVINHRMTLNNS